MAKRGHYHNSNKPVYPVKITRTTLVEEPSDEEGFNFWKWIALTAVVLLATYVMYNRPDQLRDIFNMFNNLHTQRYEDPYKGAWPEQTWPDDNWGPPAYTK